MVELLFRHMYLLNLARKYSVLPLSPLNRVGALPSSLTGLPLVLLSSLSYLLRGGLFFLARGFLGGNPLGVCEENAVLIGIPWGRSSGW
jgi:hypothetical protein